MEGGQSIVPRQCHLQASSFQPPAQAFDAPLVRRRFRAALLGVCARAEACLHQKVRGGAHRIQFHRGVHVRDGPRAGRVPERARVHARGRGHHIPALG